MATNDIQFQQEIRAIINTLQNQVGQFVIEINKVQSQLFGKLLTQPKVNLRENVSAVILQNEKRLDEPSPPPQVTKEKDQKLKEVNEEGKNSKAPKVSIPAPLPIYVTKALFPSRLVKNKKDDAEKDRDFLETFKKVKVNIPLLDTIKQISKYAKFLKEICIQRRRLKVANGIEGSINNVHDAVVESKTQREMELKSIEEFSEKGKEH